MQLKSLKIVIFCVIVIFFNSCGTVNKLTPPKETNIDLIQNKAQKIIVSNKGEYLFGILINKETLNFVKTISLQEKYDKKNFELIKVFETGVYPSFEPNKLSREHNSVFRDTTFDIVNLDAIKSNENAKITQITNFDEKKFLQISKQALENLNLTVDLMAKENIDEEYTTVEVLIQHKPTIKLKKELFFIDESAIYADLKDVIYLSPYYQKRIYKLGIPTGKNRVKVDITSIDLETANDTAIIENKFKAKPNLHVIAIGINEFPKWGQNKKLDNAINDANLMKKVIYARSGKLFDKKINILPSILNIHKTTKRSIQDTISKIKQNVKPNDYFLLYVASHGVIYDKEDKYYFATSDFAESETFLNGIGDTQIADYLLNIPTIFRMVILDTCHAGKEIEVIKEHIRNLSIGKKEGISVLTAAKATQEANDNYKGQGLFTYVLAQGLNGAADYNEDSVVDSIEIAYYVQEQVYKTSREETTMPQDAMILPDPKASYTKRFELTLLEKKKFYGFQPNIFTPKEYELYINAIKDRNRAMMNGVIRNNTRHHHNHKTLSISGKNLSVESIINALLSTGSIDIDINFPSNMSNITPDEMKKLKIIIKALQDHRFKDKGIFVEGHTDNKGTREHNLQLSQKRSDAVKEIIQTKIAKANITSLGYGEIYPTADNNTLQGQAKNRRVSIFLYDN